MSIDQQSCVQLQLYETTSTIFWQGKASKWKFQARHILISGFILILHMLWWIGSDLIEHVSFDHTLMANLFHNILNKRILVVTKNMWFCFSSSVPIHSSGFSHSSISSSIHPAWPGNRDIPEVDLSLVQNSLRNSSTKLTQVSTKCTGFESVYFAQDQSLSPT